jgi:osmotically-inducible protein OsmY
LWASGYPELHRVDIEVHERDVCLSGRVSSYFQKQLAQEFVKRIPGIAGLHNEIRVVQSAKG